MIFCYYDSPVGKLTLCAEGSSIISLTMETPPPAVAVHSPTDPTLILAVTWLEAYFGGKKPDIHSLPLSPSGTPFQKTVWRLLQQIPFGTTTTYGALAKKVAREMGVSSMSSQAIGGAVGRNPIAVIIPCHRVIGAGGKLTGFAYGISKKEALLRLEGAI